MSISSPLEQPDLFVRFPARSKMLDAYLGDIPQMLKLCRWEQALARAMTLPHVAVALSNENLHSSGLAYRKWCREWVRPALEDAVYDGWSRRAMRCDDERVEQVPFAALRTLRMGRWERSVRVHLSIESSPQPEYRALVDTCRTLMSATLRWYMQTGRQHQTVQVNLGRLGVLH